MNKITVSLSILFMMNTLLAISSNDKVVNLNENDSILLNVYYLHKKPFDVDKELVWRTDSMILSVGNQFSVYYDMNKYRRDSLDNADLLYNPNFRSIRFTSDIEALELRLQRQDDIYAIFDTSSGESAQIYKNRSAKNIITKDTYTDDIYILNEQGIVHDWTMHEDTTSILNFVCQTATMEFRGREYTAWFTMDIPINDGPWKLYGLPGLIMKVEDSEGILNIEAFGIMTDVEKKEIALPSDKRFIKCDDYRALQKVRRERNKKVSYAFIENGGMLFIRVPNPAKVIEIEK